MKNALRRFIPAMLVAGLIAPAVVIASANAASAANTCTVYNYTPYTSSSGVAGKYNITCNPLTSGTIYTQLWANNGGTWIQKGGTSFTHSAGTGGYVNYVRSWNPCKSGTNTYYTWVKFVMSNGNSAFDTSAVGTACLTN